MSDHYRKTLKRTQTSEPKGTVLGAKIVTILLFVGPCRENRVSKGVTFFDTKTEQLESSAPGLGGLARPEGGYSPGSLEARVRSDPGPQKLKNMIQDPSKQISKQQHSNNPPKSSIVETLAPKTLHFGSHFGGRCPSETKQTAAEGYQNPGFDPSKKCLKN